MMLKHTLISLVLSVGVANSSIANEIQKFPTELICGKEENIAEVLNKYEEIPFATMLSTREISGLGITSNSMVIFVNPKTKSYTIIEQLTKDVYCIVALGENINPYIEEK